MDVSDFVPCLPYDEGGVKGGVKGPVKGPVKSPVEGRVGPQVSLDNIHVEILSECVDGPLSLAEIAGRLELKGGTCYLKGGAAMLRENNLIAYTIPEIPLSRLQKYQITEAGLSILKQYTEEKKSLVEGLVEGLVKGPVRGLVEGQVEGHVKAHDLPTLC